MGLPAAIAATTTTTTATAAVTTPAAAAAARVHLFRFATSAAIRAPSRRSETFLLEESLLTLGENVAAAAIAASQSLIGHPTALLFLFPFVHSRAGQSFWWHVCFIRLRHPFRDSGKGNSLYRLSRNLSIGFSHVYLCRNTSRFVQKPARISACPG